MDDPNQGGSIPADDSSGGIGSGDSGGGYTPPVSEPTVPAEETPSQEPVSTPEPEQGDGNVGGNVGGDQNPAGGTPGM